METVLAKGAVPALDDYPVEEVLSTDAVKVTMHHHAESVVRYSEHSGWCTKSRGTAENYLKSGAIFTFAKKGQRATRPSYQLFVQHKNKRAFELRASGNEYTRIETLKKRWPCVAEFLDSIIDTTSEKHYDLHSEMFIDGAQIYAAGEVLPDTMNGIVDVIDMEGNVHQKAAGDQLPADMNGAVMVQDETNDGTFILQPPRRETPNFEAMDDLVWHSLAQPERLRDDQLIEVLQYSYTTEDPELVGPEYRRSATFNRKIEIECNTRPNQHIIQGLRVGEMATLSFMENDGRMILSEGVPELISTTVEPGEESTTRIVFILDRQ